MSYSKRNVFKRTDPSKNMRQFGVAHEIQTLFMSDNFDLPVFFNMSKQFLAPGGLSAECFMF